MMARVKRGPTIAELREKVARAAKRGPVGRDIGAMSYAERDAYLFGIDGAQD